MYLVAEGGNGCYHKPAHNDWLGAGWRDTDICQATAKKNGLPYAF
jgi:hypothetical protein